jgi:hypothetical protein
MRLKEEHPQTPTEQLIFDTMVAEGYSPEQIQFRNTNGDGPRYLRYGYWNRVYLKNAEVMALLTEQDDYDDDCGYLFMYDFINQ